MVNEASGELLRPQRYIPKNLENYFKNDSIFESDCLTPFIKKLKPGSTVIDLACGVGIETRIMEKAGMKVIPVDGNPNFLKTIKTKFPKIIESSALLKELYLFITQYKPIGEWFNKRGYYLEATQRRLLADVNQLPLEKATVDGILIKHLFTFGSDEQRTAILKECARTLKENGVLALYNEVIDYKSRPFLPKDSTPIFPINSTIIKKLLESAGFEIEEIKKVSSETDRWKEEDNQMVVFANKLTTN